MARCRALKAPVLNHLIPTAADAVPTRGIFDHTPQSLRAILCDWNEPEYRVAQVFEWVFGRSVCRYESMTNLPKPLRARLEAEVPLYRSTVKFRQDSNDDTVKLLLCWPDGTTSECVLIRDGERRTACVSTQVGCPVGCAFCASGMGGFSRQLSTGQIVEQAMRLCTLCESSTRLSNVVFMGTGEPLANYHATLQAVRTINAEWGMAIGARKITISTIGPPKQMRRLADENLQITLALSLHAPSDELRRELIPWAESVTIESLVEAAVYYFDRTGREVTIEYTLLGGINDSESHARQLAAVAKRMRSNVNLLAFNPVEGLPYQRPAERTVQRFLSVLRSLGVNAHLRRSRGLGINAACGQLRRREQAPTPSSVQEV